MSSLLIQFSLATAASPHFMEFAHRQQFKVRRCHFASTTSNGTLVQKIICFVTHEKKKNKCVWRVFDVHICTTNRISHSRVLSFSKKTGTAVGVNAISPAVSVQSLDQHGRPGLQKQDSLLCSLTDKQPVRPINHLRGLTNGNTRFYIM